MRWLSDEHDGGAPVVVVERILTVLGATVVRRIEHQGVLWWRVCHRSPDASPRSGPPRQWRVSAVARGGGARTTAGVAEAEARCCGRGRSASRTCAEQYARVPDRHARRRSRSSWTSRSSWSGSHAALRAGLRPRRGCAQAVSASRRTSTGASTWDDAGVAGYAPFLSAQARQRGAAATSTLGRSRG